MDGECLSATLQSGRYVMAGRGLAGLGTGKNDWAIEGRGNNTAGGERPALGDPLHLDDIEAAETQMLIVPGTGVSMGNPFIKRRQRSLTLRLAILGLMACVLLTGVFAVTPLGSNAAGSLSSFQALSGSVIWGKGPEY